jgi:hypothetical protein
MPKFLNTVFARDTTDCTGPNTGGLQVAGGAYVTKKFRADGQVTFNDSTQATSSTAAAVTIPNGGLGIGLDLRVGGSAYVSRLYADFYSYAPYFQATIAPGAGLIGYWNGAGSWGLGWDNSGSHTVRLGVTNSTADFQTPPGDLIFKVDGNLAPVGTVQLAAGVAARPSMNIPNGVAPDIRATGDIWAAAGHLYYYDGATNKDLTAAGSGLTNPMTTLGDLIYGVMAGSPQRLAGNTTTTPQFLKSLGSGGLATAPAWAQIAAADLSDGVSGTGNLVKVTGPTFTGGKVTLAATATGYASLNVPAGTAPTTPASGDAWNAGGVLFWNDGTATQPLSDVVTTATGNGTLNLDGNNKNVVKISLTGTTTINMVNGGRSGQRLMLELTQDSTGNRGVTLGTGFAWGADLTSYSPTLTANKTDYIGLIYHAGTSLWRVTAISKGY